VNLIGVQLLTVNYAFKGLQAVRAVLQSKPGEAVFPAEPPSSPDAV
jgi:hypothetical protein